jgi:hypothetical protein
MAGEHTGSTVALKPGLVEWRPEQLAGRGKQKAEN